MERPDDAPLADEGRRGAIPDDQPLAGPAGPGDENMPSRPAASEPGGGGPREPSPEKDNDQSWAAVGAARAGSSAGARFFDDWEERWAHRHEPR